MKAVGYTKPGSTEVLSDIEIDRPTATGRDLLVEVHAVSVNPVDTKIRANADPFDDDPRILGWDGVGEVVEVGPDVKGFEEGDMVWYAGAIDRQGTNAEFHLVDSRIVGKKPTTLSAADAAALPLTSLTAWEMLFDRLQITDALIGGAEALVIIGGAGGVGSIATQFARTLTDITVIATASRPETSEWVTELGAHHVINHHEPLAPQVEALDIGMPAFVFSTNHSHDYVEQVAELIAPQGRFGLIDDPENFNIMPFKAKSISTHWELMFTRSLFTTDDIARQGRILTEVAGLVDAGRIRSTATQTLGAINAENLRTAHAHLETNTARGKIVLEGF